MAEEDKTTPETNEPPPGSWAAVARIMASMPQDPDEPPIDWDAWKDEMKDREAEEQHG